jgi:hypothetical protein
MSSRLTIASTLLAAAALLALSGCAGGEATPAISASGTDATEPDEAGADGEIGPDCLIGDWYIENDEMQGFYDALAESTDSPVGFDITGGTGLSFTATEYTYTPDFGLELTVSGIDASGVITGQVIGDYEASETVITTSHEESNVELIVTIAGVAQDGTDLFGDILRSAPINSAPYECGPNGPIIGFETSGERHSVHLTARG